MGRSAEFETLQGEFGAEWTSFLGARTVAHYGDSDAEYRAVRFDGLGVADRSERETVVVDGTDAVELIQGLVTSDVFELAEPGSGQLSCAVNVKGRMICDLRFLHAVDLLLVDLEPGTIESGAIAHFKGNIINEDARFLDRTEATSRIAVFGERAASTLRDLADVRDDLGALEDYQGTWGSLADRDVVIQRIPLTGAPGFDISCGTTDAPTIWRAIFDEDASARPVGHEALERLRIEAGIPRFGVEMDEKTIPLEAGLDDAISYHKGCYLGQEIIARLDTLGTPAKELRTLVLEGDRLPEPGHPIYDGDKKVGDVRSVAMSGVAEAPIALAYLKRDHNEPGHEITVHYGDNREAEGVGARVQELGALLARVRTDNAGAAE